MEQTKELLENIKNSISIQTFYSDGYIMNNRIINRFIITNNANLRVLFLFQIELTLICIYHLFFVY